MENAHGHGRWVDAVSRTPQSPGSVTDVRIAEPSAHSAVRRIRDVLRGDRRPGMADIRNPRDRLGRPTLRPKGSDVT